MKKQRKVVQINSFNAGSTGKIAIAINNEAEKRGWETHFLYGRSWKGNKSIKNGEQISYSWDNFIHAGLSRFFDCVGRLSYFSTLRLIRKLKVIKPDIVHLHNIHGYYLNYPLLFKYLKEQNIPVVWTLHDCWSVTGHCPYFDSIGCEKWKTQCFKCELKKTYPKSLLLDNSQSNYKLKKKAFTSLNSLTLVPVSDWLKDIVKESYLRDQHVITIHNGIDTDKFSPTPLETREKYILGVASPWSVYKGFNDYIKLRSILDPSISIVMVGLSKEQLAQLPDGIRGIEHTNNIEEMVELYSNAIAFVNMTYEDNFPTTNIEALACGTPVITYRTGGSPEAIDETTGLVVDRGDWRNIPNAIYEIEKNGYSYYSSNCRSRAVKLFNGINQYAKYVDIYEKILS